MQTKLDLGELEPDEVTVIEDQLFEILGMEKSSFHNIPAAKIRNDSSALEKILAMKNSSRAQEELIRVMTCISEAAAKILMPNNVDWILNKLCSKLSKSYSTKDELKRHKVLERLAKELIDLVNSMPKHSFAYRIARAILVSNATPSELNQSLGDLEPPKFGSRRYGKIDR